MVFLTAPLGLVGAAPTLLLFAQPFGFNAILGLIGLAGILMRNTLILLGQIEADRKDGLSPREAVIEATVRRSRPVVLTAAAAMLAFVPLTLSSFWGPLAFTLIGGVGVGTVLTLLFLPALYALFFNVPRARPDKRGEGSRSGPREGNLPTTRWQIAGSGQASEKAFIERRLAEEKPRLSGKATWRSAARATCFSNHSQHTRAQVGVAADSGREGCFITNTLGSSLTTLISRCN